MCFKIELMPTFYLKISFFTSSNILLKGGTKKKDKQWDFISHEKSMRLMMQRGHQRPPLATKDSAIRNIWISNPLVFYSVFMHLCHHRDLPADQYLLESACRSFTLVNCVEKCCSAFRAKKISSDLNYDHKTWHTRKGVPRTPVKPCTKYKRSVSETTSNDNMFVGNIHFLAPKSKVLWTRSSVVRFPWGVTTIFLSLAFMGLTGKLWHR